jgi:transketolase
MGATKATREAFGEALRDLGAAHPEVVVLDADLSKSTKTDLFAKAFPDRFFEIGIQEMNLIGVAAGLALSGKVPFIASFACFVTGRFDQIKMSVSYSRARVRIVGSHAGIGIGEDGYSQQGLEDIALMRSLPEMAVIQPCDDLETRGAVEYLLAHPGPAYLRVVRQKVGRVNPEGYHFEFGKGVTLRPGRDLTIVASGAVVEGALGAAAELAAEGIDARVVNIHTIKPLDVELLVTCARETGRILTVEDHQITGGLGGAVCEALAEHYPAPVRRHGVRDVFGESGTPAAVYAAHGLDAPGIAREARELVGAAAPAAPPAGS